MATDGAENMRTTMAEPARPNIAPWWGWRPARFWLPPLALFLIWMGASLLSPKRASQSFFEASAQIIPVLILTLAVEARVFEWNVPWEGWDRWWADPLT